MEKQWHSFSPDIVFGLLESKKSGLDGENAAARLAVSGLNEFERKKKSGVLIVLFNQFRNAFILLLIFAGILSLVLGETLEAIAVFGIVLLNVFLGFIQEYNAERAIEMLEKISAPTARVLRSGKITRIPAKEIVPGDIVLFEAGDIVPADARIFEAVSLKIDEASLTGESVPSKKIVGILPEGTSVADRENMAFTSTVVTYGKGSGIVVSTGMQTELGKIAASLHSEKETKTPLEIKFEQMAKQISVIAAVLVLLVLVFGTMGGTKPFNELVLLALALTVSTVPNALPIIVTVSLSLGSKRLAKQKMLVKKLSAAESLGAVTVICSDKTGTITKNEMTVTTILVDGITATVSGTGYGLEGDFFFEEKKIEPERFGLIAKIACLCNDSKLSKNNKKIEITGDPTEGALLVMAEKAGLNEEILLKEYSIVEELPFDSERKMMTVITKNKNSGKFEALIKGAPDLLLRVCDKIIENKKVRKLTDLDRQKILKTNGDFAKKALRVIGFAFKETRQEKNFCTEETEKSLVFAGLAGMIDPPREEVEKSIIQCNEAGIKVMIITGDHSLTAKAIAEQIGLFKETDTILCGDEIEKMTDEELGEKIENVRIIARALPIQKSRIVLALQKHGHIVAMTGDGVNDAPALKKADIGIAMGITGTDVAKEVSKAVLVDDNFATIVNAIVEGRNIYDKILKSARYLLSCNSGEISTVLVAVILNFPLPILPLQLLLMNILTDDLPALGLGSEPAEEGIMKRKPRDPRANPLSKKMAISIVLFGIIMMLGTIFVFIQHKDNNLARAQTAAFTTLVMFQMFAVMSNRSLNSFTKINPFSNPFLIVAIFVSVIIQLLVIYWQPLQEMFKTVWLSPADWLLILAISSFGFIAMEAIKFGMNKLMPNRDSCHIS